MSHFTVCVAGNDPDYELAPFHEFECTGVDDEFVQDVDITEEVKKAIKEQGSLKAALEDYGYDDKVVKSEDEIDKIELHKYGYAVIQNKKLVKAVRRTNPNKKWDWHQTGGRWAGHWQIKPEFLEEYKDESPNFSWGWDAKSITETLSERRVDSALKKHIDFAAMRAKSEAEAGKLWDKVHTIIDPLPPIISWTEVREERFKDNIEAAREFYGSQPAIAAVREWNAKNEHALGFFDEIEPLLVPREQYVKDCGDGAAATFAVVKNRQWSERGRMGWWAFVSDEKDTQTWNSMFQKFIDSLGDDERLTVVDCHI